MKCRHCQNPILWDPDVEKWYHHTKVGVKLRFCFWINDLPKHLTATPEEPEDLPLEGKV